ncbi:MAG TPA: HEAT repeat domain-containing protein [Nitrospirota bacterium]|nr:HEAT repeat domain-containing protein [Nitrospirota bacterium]
MHDNLTTIAVVATIVSLLLLIVVLVITSVMRRVWNLRKYRKLDTLRQKYRQRMQVVLKERDLAKHVETFSSKPGSAAWQAVEEILLDLTNDEMISVEAKTLLQKIGYVSYYENKLTSRKELTRAFAIDKLGRMGSPSSTRKLIPLLNESNPEILTVTVRALSRIGSKEGLLAIIERLPVLLGKTLVTRKAMGTALLNFGDDAIPYLVTYEAEQNDPWIMSCVLETLSHLTPDPRAQLLAIEHLGSQNAEVRSKALKVLAQVDQPSPTHLPELIAPLLDDQVWFVRLQAIKSARELGCETMARPIGKLLFDKNWYVRSEAALALTQLGACAVDVFLDALKTEDTYAKESVCEEIERSQFIDWLIAHLDREDETMRTKSREILKIMHSLNFSSQLMEYLTRDGNERIKEQVRELLTEDRVR